MNDHKSGLTLKNSLILKSGLISKTVLSRKTEPVWETGAGDWRRSGSGRQSLKGWRQPVRK